jgi:hypothetical protein
MSFNLIRRGSFALGAVIAALTIAACGSSSSSSSSASSSSSGTAAASTGGAGSRRGFFGDPAQRAKLTACLKQHGVTLPTRPPVPQGSGAPGSSGSSSGSGTTPGGAPPGSGSGRPRFFGGGGGSGRGFFGGGGGGFAGNPKVRAALKACGANFRTRGRFNPAARKAAINKFITCVRQHGYNLPNPNFSGHGAVFPSKIQSDPKFQAASKACASLLRPPGGPGNGAPPPSSA